MARKLRVDAQENRDRILVAARRSFAERGLDVGMREVARRAGVGPATLYRRFPSRQALIEDVLTGELDTCRRIVEQGAEDPDPERGLRTAVRDLIAHNADGRGFADALLAARETGPGLGEHRRALLGLLGELLRRAGERGGLRADLTVDDLVLALIAGRALASVDPERRAAAAQRFATLVFDGFRR